MVHLNKKLVFAILTFSIVGLLQASDASLYPPQQSEREWVLSSMVIGSLVGAFCGAVDYKTRFDPMPFTWVASYFIRTSLIGAIQYEQGNNRITIDRAHGAACASSWLAWAIVYFRLLS